VLSFSTFAEDASPFSKYDFMIQYVKGRYLHVADTLSREHQNDSVEDINSEEI